jgi:hypothetical protein
MCDPCLDSGMDATQRDDLRRLPHLNDVDDEPLAWAAYFYARAGIPVHPLAPRRKSPRTENGYLDATTDLRQVEAWWRETPDANIGLATGHEFDVLDVDVKDGQPGDESFARLEAAGLLPGAWAVASTPSGGRHVLFIPSGDGCHSKPALGLDFKARDLKGVGGYIVGAPSYTKEIRDKAGKIDQYEGRYEWQWSDPDLRGGPFDWQAAMAHLGGAAPPRTPPVAPASDQPTSSRLAGLLRFVAAQLPTSHNRNTALRWAANRLTEYGYPPSAWEALAEVGRSTGLPDWEVRKVLRDGPIGRAA